MEQVQWYVLRDSEPTVSWFWHLSGLLETLVQVLALKEAKWDWVYEYYFKYLNRQPGVWSEVSLFLFLCSIVELMKLSQYIFFFHSNL